MERYYFLVGYLFDSRDEQGELKEKDGMMLSMVSAVFPTYSDLINLFLDGNPELGITPDKVKVISLTKCEEYEYRIFTSGGNSIDLLKS